MTWTWTWQILHDTYILNLGTAARFSHNVSVTSNRWHSQLLKWIWKHSPTEHFYTAVSLLQFKLPTQYCKWEQTGANESNIQMAPTSCQWEDVIGEQPPVMLPLILSWPVTGWPIKSCSERLGAEVQGEGISTCTWPSREGEHILPLRSYHTLPPAFQLHAWACFN